MKRIDYTQASPGAFKAMQGLENHVRASGLEHSLLELVKTRVSQINGCAFCLNLHAPEAREAGISQQKLDVLAAWRESPAFDNRERAALGWAESLTRIEVTGVPDAEYAALAEAFDERERADLTLIVTTINAWNRFAVGFRTPHPVQAGAAP